MQRVLLIVVDRVKIDYLFSILISVVKQDLFAQKLNWFLHLIVQTAAFLNELHYECFRRSVELSLLVSIIKVDYDQISHEMQCMFLQITQYSGMVKVLPHL